VHISLFEISKFTAVFENDQNLAERKRRILTCTAQAHPQNVAVVNAKFVASLCHLQIAVANALVKHRDGKMKTAGLGNEITYSLSSQHSI
jgi:tRNA threonylcarbamoyladenosine modification (KEOPS) complex Cgi121 subunit